MATQVDINPLRGKDVLEAHMCGGSVLFSFRGNENSTIRASAGPAPGKK